MGIKGKAREGSDYVKKTGFFEARVAAINPDREQLEKMLGVNLEKDPEYLGEDADGNGKLTLCIWLKDVTDGTCRPVRFYLKDVERSTKTKDKKQFINSVGQTTWADKEDNLPEWFKARGCRVAKEGEEEMYNFAVNWLNKLDTRDAETVLSFDWKRLLKGNVKEIEDQIGGEYDGTITCLLTVKTVDKNGEPVDYEQIYNKEFLPGYEMKKIKMKKIDESFINAANAIEKKKQSKLQKFVLNVTKKPYGIKEYFTLGELEAYDPSKNIASRNDILDGDTSY